MFARGIGHLGRNCSSPAQLLCSGTWRCNPPIFDFRAFPLSVRFSFLIGRWWRSFLEDRRLGVLWRSVFLFSSAVGDHLSLQSAAELAVPACATPLEAIGALRQGTTARNAALSALARRICCPIPPSLLPLSILHPAFCLSFLFFRYNAGSRRIHRTNHTGRDLNQD